MEKTNIPWLSCDVLRIVMVEAIEDPIQRKQKFPFVEAGDYNKFFQTPTDEIVRKHFEKAESLWPTIQSFIRHQILVRDDFILEGIYILPHHIQELLGDEFYAKNVKSIFITATDEDIVLQGLHSNTGHYDWLEGASDTTKKAVTKYVVAVSHKILHDVEQVKLPLFERTPDFESDVVTIVDRLSSS